MFLSVFELFKIGIGPSSSHTVGPMVAARRFLSNARAENAARVTVSLHGSLAFTGKGHGTDRACVLGLAGEAPDAIEPDRVDAVVQEVAERKYITLPNGKRVSFDPVKDVIFDYGPALPGHANGMIFTLWDASGTKVFSETYYSIGGGFVQTEAERLESKSQDRAAAKPKLAVPYPFSTAKEMLEMGKASGLSIAAMKRANETCVMTAEELDARLDRIWAAMNACMNRGLSMGGTLPGGLKVKRRAREIFAALKAEQGGNSMQPHRIMDFLSVYALAVNEENAAGGKAVTAPTNGAAGVMPAIVRYYLDHCLDADEAGVRTLLLVSSAIGGIIKHNASISGAEVGCQGEVGSASAMAAAGLCAALGGTNEQVENAA
ncbi:MAG TPA: L-serine ammonia-lyase, partial [Aestuariivirga sp.]|nr:L-serine ammonia-lyase [Aestuariivirga sp.]